MLKGGGSTLPCSTYLRWTPGSPGGFGGLWSSLTWAHSRIHPSSTMGGCCVWGHSSFAGDHCHAGCGIVLVCWWGVVCCGGWAWGCGVVVVGIHWREHVVSGGRHCPWCGTLIWVCHVSCFVVGVIVVLVTGLWAFLIEWVVGTT